MSDELKIDDGGQAFPGGVSAGYDPRDGKEWKTGMTLRQYYAGLAMQGVLSDYDYHEMLGFEDIARESVKLADALIAELKKGTA